MKDGNKYITDAKFDTTEYKFCTNVAPLRQNFANFANMPPFAKLCNIMQNCEIRFFLMRTAPVAKSELSASIWKGLELSGDIRIWVDVMRSFKVLKASCSSADHFHITSFLVRSKSGRAL